MRLTPLEIRKQPFRKKMMGFDADEVNSFLQMVANEYESLIKQNDEQATDLKILTEKLEHYVKIEKTLNQTLITAQRATDEARINAQKEAELIIKDAQVQAHSFEANARQRVHQLENELITLRNQRDAFLSRFKSVLNTQLALLNTISGDLKSPREEEMIKEDEETMDEVLPQPELTAGDDTGGVVV
jgi:cell division initiation protein